MSERTYSPTGHGLCATCGRDVGEHDAGHAFDPSASGNRYWCGVVFCNMPEKHPIHDVGRVLRCPD